MSMTSKIFVVLAVVALALLAAPCADATDAAASFVRPVQGARVQNKKPLAIEISLRDSGKISYTDVRIYVLKYNPSAFIPERLQTVCEGCSVKNGKVNAGVTLNAGSSKIVTLRVQGRYQARGAAKADAFSQTVTIRVA